MFSKTDNFEVPISGQGANYEASQFAMTKGGPKWIPPQAETGEALENVVIRMILCRLEVAQSVELYVSFRYCLLPALAVVSVYSFNE